ATVADSFVEQAEAIIDEFVPKTASEYATFLQVVERMREMTERLWVNLEAAEVHADGSEELRAAFQRSDEEYVMLLEQYGWMRKYGMDRFGAPKFFLTEKGNVVTPMTDYVVDSKAKSD